MRSLRFNSDPAAQHEEELTVEHDDGREETMRLHEYDRVYSIPGLYDEILKRLEYASPAKVAELLLGAPGVDPAQLRVLDLAAGNGVSADPLLAGGAGPLVGMDLIPEAREATLRERPEAYAEYVAGDIGEPGLVAGLVERYDLNALGCSGGISHIPVEAFEVGWGAFPSGSWLVATAAEELGEPTGGVYGAWVAGEAQAGRLTDVYSERFVHRLAMSGEPITYTALRARKA